MSLYLHPLPYRALRLGLLKAQDNNETFGRHLTWPFPLFVVRAWILNPLIPGPLLIVVLVP
jgi:hypothetical protein